MVTEVDTIQLSQGRIFLAAEEEEDCKN